MIDNLVGGREENLAQHRGNPRVRFDGPVDMVTPPTLPLFKGVDYVFHFGGIGDIVPSIERPLDYMRANVNGTLAVLEAARHARVRKLVYAASSSCYGLAAELPTTEAAAIKPGYPYALSKYLGECAALHWGQVYGLPVISIRMFNVYGPREDHRRLRRGVRSLPRPEAPRQAVHRGGRRTQAARLRLRHRRGPRLSAGGGVDRKGEI